MADTASKTSPSWGLVLVRIAVGWILIKAGWPKVSGGVSPDLVSGTSENFAQAPAIVRWWGQNVVLQFPWLFAHMIAYGELLGGLALFLGAFTRQVGILVAFQFANFYFAGPADARLFVTLISVCGLGCAISRAGRRFGADALLDERLPRWMTW